MKKQGLNSIFLSLILIITIAFSCQKEEVCVIGNRALIGSWADTVSVTDGGTFVDELTLHESGLFTKIINSYGVYEGQDELDLSGWHILSGTFSQEGDRLNFQSEKAVSWDSFSGDDPIAKVEKQTIFENCTFTIHDDLLELSYITYPADAPEITIKVYRRCEK